MSSVVDQLRQAATALEAADVGGLVGPVATGYRDTVDGMSRRADLAARFRDSMQLATTMFGGQRRYLLIVPALGVPRPGGGIPAAAGILVVDNGSIRLEAMMTAPKAIADVDVSPEWPKTARTLMETVAGSEIGAVDGVISIDAVALQDLVWMIGDVGSDGVGFSDETTTTGVEIDPFLGNDPPKAARVHAARVSQILEAFLDRRPGVESFALAAAADARGRHLSIYLPSAEERRLIRSLGLDGGARVRGEGILPVIATWSSLGNAHVGALVKTTVQQTVTIRPNGSALVEAEVLFDNGAETEPPSVLLGTPVGGLPVGTFAADVALYVPKTAKHIAAETSQPGPIISGQDLGLATVTGSIEVRGGGSTSLTVSYSVAGAVRTVDGAKEVVVRVVPQPTLSGVRYQLRIALPDGIDHPVSIARTRGTRRQRDVLGRPGWDRGPRAPFR